MDHLNGRALGNTIDLANYVETRILLFTGGQERRPTTACINYIFKIQFVSAAAILSNK
jgi:hypothetical protein